MKKIFNQRENIISEQLEGFTDAYSHFYEPYTEKRAYVVSKSRRSGKKVSLIIGGGSGHEPMFSGFVGKGLADAAVCGNIFAAPNPMLIYNAAHEVDNGEGVLFVYGNYTGDNLNFDVAEEMLADDGIRCTHVRIWDDCASAPKERIEDRRGIAGNLFVLKIAGAACDAGLSLDEVTRITEKARDHVNTIGLATSPGTIPGEENPAFALGEDEIEYGMGIHGEPGIERAKIQPADILVERLYSELKREMDLGEDKEICILVNGLGSTTILELSIAYRKFAQLAKKDGMKIHDAEINNFCTCQEMGGFSISVLVLDDELREYYDAPCYCPYYAKEDRR